MARRISHGSPTVPMNMRFRLNSIATRIAVPVLIISLLGGFGLYTAMQRTLAKFSERQIGQYLSSMAANVYSICEGSGNGFMGSSPSADSREVRVRKALTIGALEDFFRQNGLIGFIMDGEQRISLNRELEPDLRSALELNAVSREVTLLRLDGDRYAAVGVSYPPWGWHIVVARERTAFASMANDIRWLYLSIAFMLIVGFAGLMIVLEETVRSPIQAIIDTIRKGGRPASTGVAEFDFLADQLQHSIRQRNTLLVNMERTHFLYSHDIRGHFTYVSPSIADILGYRPEEFLNHYSTFMTDHPRNRDVARFTSLSIQGQLQPPYEVEVYHRDGSRRWLSVAETPVFGDDGTVTAVEGVARDITGTKLAEDERDRLIGELRSALAEIRTLRGIIPICASCKKVRDDEGAWQQVEAYLSSHTDAEFSHGICPDCLHKMYPNASEKDR